MKSKQFIIWRNKRKFSENKIIFIIIEFELSVYTFVGVFQLEILAQTEE